MTISSQALSLAEQRGRDGYGRCWNVVYADGSLRILSAPTRAIARAIANEYGLVVLFGAKVSALQELRPDSYS
jgi:hypothetical protein